MSTNEPSFDPLNASPEEEADIVAGYLAGFRGGDLTSLASRAWEHGYRNGRNDKLRVCDFDQVKLARRARQIREDADGRRQKLRAGLREPTKRFGL